MSSASTMTRRKIKVARKTVQQQQIQPTQSSAPPPDKFSLDSLIKKAADPQLNLAQWQAANQAAAEQVVTNTANNRHLDLGQAQYHNYQDVIQNITQKKPMTSREMRELQKNIGKLDQEAHIGICKILVHRVSQDLYTVNNYGFHFDLKELEASVLWQIHYHVNLCLEDVARQKVKEEAQRQFNKDMQDNPQYQKMQANSNRNQQNIFHQQLPNYTVDNVPSYEDLRQDALKNLQTSQASVHDNPFEDKLISDDEVDEEPIPEISELDPDDVQVDPSEIDYEEDE